MLLTFLFVAALVTVRTQDVRQTCDTMFCAKGQECVEMYETPTCECIERCRDPISPVCGSDGQTYINECELDKEACMKMQTIQKIADVSCEEDMRLKKEKSKKIQNSKMKKPMACYEKDRTKAREAIMSWLQKNLRLDEDHMDYKTLLFTYFIKFDVNSDNVLDRDEYSTILDSDHLIKEVLDYEFSENPLLQGLCLKELVYMSDDGADDELKMTFEQFYKCFDPEFKPPKQKCELEGSLYDDGDDVTKDCNTCTCACGKWVCTHNDCKENSSKAIFMRDMSDDAI